MHHRCSLVLGAGGALECGRPSQCTHTFNRNVLRYSPRDCLDVSFYTAPHLTSFHSWVVEIVIHSGSLFQLTPVDKKLMSLTPFPFPCICSTHCLHVLIWRTSSRLSSCPLYYSTQQPLLPLVPKTNSLNVWKQSSPIALLSFPFYHWSLLSKPFLLPCL